MGMSGGGSSGPSEQEIATRNKQLAYQNKQIDWSTQQFDKLKSTMPTTVESIGIDSPQSQTISNYLNNDAKIKANELLNQEQNGASGGNERFSSFQATRQAKLGQYLGQLTNANAITGMNSARSNYDDDLANKTNLMKFYMNGGGNFATNTGSTASSGSGSSTVGNLLTAADSATGAFQSAKKAGTGAALGTAVGSLFGAPTVGAAIGGAAGKAVSQ